MTPRRILLLGWLVFLLYAFPGYMTSRSVEMLDAARYWELLDWNPPLFSVVWRIVIAFWYGPAGMLFLQSGCLLFGGYVLLRRHVPARTAAIASAGVLVFPPVMAAMAVIDQDALLTGVLVVMLALFGSEVRRNKIIGLVLLVLASGLRDTAWIATLPLVVFGFTWDPAHRRVVRYAIAAGAWLASALLAYGLTNALYDFVSRRDESNLAMHDVAGTLARTEKLTDAQVRALAPGVKFSRLFDLQETARLRRSKQREYYAGPNGLFLEPTTDADVEALLAARARLRSHDPGAYAATRWKQWQRVLDPRKARDATVYTKDNLNPEVRIASGHGASKSKVQLALVWMVRLVAKTPLFAPFFYLAIALVLLPFARRCRPMLVLLASGILLELALALITSDAEYRYSTWLVTATVLAGFVTVHRMVSAPRTPV